jgi:hypothetical protein
MISLPRLNPRSPVFLVMAQNQASPLQHGSMAKIKTASVNVMQQNGIKRKDLLRITNKPI